MRRIPLLAALALAVSVCAFAADTPIADVIYSPVNAKPANGQITISPSNKFVMIDGRYIAKDPTIIHFANGNISFTLVPNSQVSAAGTYYRVEYALSDGTRYGETWVVPVSTTPLKIRDVVSAINTPPSADVQLPTTQLTQTGAHNGDALVWIDSAHAWQPVPVGATSFNAVNGIVKMNGAGVASAAQLADLTSLGLGDIVSHNAADFDAAGSATTAQTNAVASSLQKGANLSDLGDATTARTNLGLGSIATHNLSDLDTSGAAAAVQAASLQKSANLSDLTNSPAARANLGLGDIATHGFAELDPAGSAAAAQAGAIYSSAQKSANLSDLASPSAARTNLGLGDSATHPASDFEPAGTATAALNGALAASVQRSANLGDLADIPTARTNLGLGTAATHNTGDFDAAGAAASAQTAAQSSGLQKSANLSDVADAPAARGNLGLGDASTHPASDFATAGSVSGAIATANGAAQKSANLADLADAPTARINLGLGDASTHAAADFDAAGAATTAGASAVTTATASSLQKSANLSDVASASAARTSLGLGDASTHPASDFDPAGAAASAATTAANTAVATAQTSGLQKAANLSDLTNTATARANIGLGTIATHAVGEFDPAGAATAAQSAAIASSAQVSNNLSDLTNTAQARTNLGLGGAAVHAVTDFDAAGSAASAQIAAQAASAQITNNLSDLSNVGAARANLGLGSIATHGTGEFDAAGAASTALATAQSTSAQVAKNLSDLTDPTAGRANLGLGTIATHNVSEFDPTGAAAQAAVTAMGASLQKSANLSDLTNATTARTNLGIGDSATHPASDFDAAGAASTAQATAQASSAQKSANLSDLTNAATARANLGLPTSSNLDFTNAANITTGTLPAAQLPASVVQTTTDAIFGGVNVDLGAASHTKPMRTGLTANKPATCTVGEMYFAIDATPGQNLFMCGAVNTWTSQVVSAPGSGGLAPSNNLSDLTNFSTARSNLGLGSAATQDVTAFLQPSNNLSDLTNVSTARSNLGLPATSVDTTIANNIISGTLPAGRLPTINGDVLIPLGGGQSVVQAVGGQTATNVANASAAWFGANTANNTLKLDTNGFVPISQTAALTGDVTKPSASSSTTVASVGGQSAANVAQVAGAWQTPNTANSPLKLDTNGRVPYAQLPAVTGDVTSLAGGGTTTVQMVGGQSANNVANAAAGWAAANSANGALKLDGAGRVSASQIPAFTGDVVSTAGTTTLTLPNIAAPGTYPKVTVNTKGQVTAGSVLTLADLPTLASTNLSDSSTILRNNQNITYGAFSFDSGGAAHTSPAKRGVIANLPATCSVGEEYFATDATAGSNKYFCTSTNIWTKNSGVTAYSLAPHQFLTSVNAAGQFQSAQPAATDITGLAGSATTDTTNAANIGSGTLSAGRLPALTGDVTTTAGSTVTTVKGLNGVNLSGLATGLLKNTTSTGAPSIALAGTDYQAPLGFTPENAANKGATNGYAPLVSSLVPLANIPVIPSTQTSGFAASATTDTTNASNIASGTLSALRLPATALQNNVNITLGAITADQSGALHTLPAKKGTAAGLPGSCTVGEQYFATDAAAGTNLYLCGSANIWTQMKTSTGSGVTAYTAPTHQYLNLVNANGTFASAQPSWGDLTGIPALTGTGAKLVSGTGTYTSGHGLIVDPTGNAIDSGKAPVAASADLSDASTILRTSQLNVATTDKIPTLVAGITPGHGVLFGNSAELEDTGSVPLLSGTACGTGQHISSFNATTGLPVCTPDSGGTASAAGTNSAIQFNSSGVLGGDATNLGYNSSTHQVAATGGFSSAGTTAGFLQMIQGAVPSSFPANSFTLFAPTTIGTAYHWQIPSADGNGLLAVNADVIGMKTLQGTDTNVLTAGTVSGMAAAPLCTDINGGATTVGCPATNVPNTSTLGQSFQNNGSTLVVTQAPIEAASVGIVCDGTTDNTTALNNGALSGHAIHLPDGATCLGRITGGVSNTTFYCKGCTLGHPANDPANRLVYIGYQNNITLDGVILDDRGDNHQSFVGGINAQTTIITESGGSGWQANYRIPFTSTGGGCVYNAAGYITTNGSGVPNGVVTYTTGNGCTSVPTGWIIGTYCGDGITGCVAPTLTWQGGLTPQTGSANVNMTYVEFSTGIVFRNCTWRSTGATAGNLAGDEDPIQTFSSQVLFDNPTIENTLRGIHLTVDSNGDETRKTIVRNITSDGSQLVAMLVRGYPGGSEVNGGLITNVGDAFAGTGADGNGIEVLNTSNNYIHGVTIRNPLFSGVRVTGDGNHASTRPTSRNRIEDVSISGNQEVGVYAEKGAEFNYFRNITVRPSATQSSYGCFEDTDIANRVHYGLNYFSDMHCTGQFAFGGLAEKAIVTNPTFVDVAVPMRVDYAGIGTGNVVRGATCTNSGGGYSSPAMCFALDRLNGGSSATQGPSLIQWNSPVDYPFGGTAMAGLTYLQTDSFPLIGGITATNPAVVTYLANTGTSNPIAVGKTYVLQGIFGFTNAAGNSINGSLCGVTAVNTTTHAVTCGGVTGVPSLDATSYTATPFTLAPQGRSNGMFWLLYGSGTTPAWTANSQFNVSNAF